MDSNSSDPIKILISELLEAKYDGVTFSEEIIGSMEAKVSLLVRKQTEELVSEYVLDFFSPKKPIRKPRKTKTKSEQKPVVVVKGESQATSVNPTEPERSSETPFPAPPSSPIF